MADGMSAVCINARFQVQGLTGVQRFAAEITAALTAIWPSERPKLRLLKPDGGGARGQIWEQVALPIAAGSGVLVNLGNTAPILRARQIVVIHDAGPEAHPEAYGWKFRLWYRLMQGALFAGRSRIVTVSGFARDELVRLHGVAPSSITILGEGAEHILRPSASPGILAAHGLEPGRFVLVVGSLAAHKNLPALGATAQMLAARGIELVITGGLAANVFAGGAPLPSPARYIGRVDDGELRALYSAAACFVFPSLYEGFGLPAVEAMACGCPVVASRAASLPEVCGDAAAFCEPGDPGDIARAVTAVLDTPDLAARLRDRGLARAADTNWRRAAERLRDVIFEVEAGR